MLYFNPRRIRSAWRGSPVGAAICLVGLLLSSSAPAQTIWSDATGSWFTPGNWNNGVPNPASGTAFDARIDNGGTAQIFAPGASVRRITLGGLSGQSGNIVVDTGSLNVTENLHLGESGLATVTVKNGGQITSQFTRIGRFAGSGGTATISGNGSSWSTTADFLVGETGSGSLTINQGADVTVGGNFLVAGAAAAQGSSVSLSGVGSTLTVTTGLLRVGDFGNANFTVDSGATVTSRDVTIANSTGSNDTVTISGTGSTWTMSTLSMVGVSGKGTFTVAGGAVVNANDTATANSFNLGDDINGNGILVVTGAGTLFDSAHDVNVGRVSNGTLSLADSGTLRIGGGTRPLHLAVNAGSTGTINIGNGGASGILLASAIQIGAGSAAINFNNTDTLNFTIPITGAAAMSKTGTGTVSLSTPYTFTGSLTVNAGIFELRSNGSLANSLPITVNTGAMAQFLDATSTHAQTINNTGIINYGDSSVAATSTLNNNPSALSNIVLGSTRFVAHSNAQSATITNFGGILANQYGGSTAFAENSSAGSSTITNQPSPIQADNSRVGTTSFNGSATAANATIINNASGIASGGGGVTAFLDNTTAANATITNRGSLQSTAGAMGQTIFGGFTAGNALFTNEGGLANGGLGGAVTFALGDGGTAKFKNLSGTVAGAFGGTTTFAGIYGPESAGHANIDNLGATAAGARGGVTSFQGDSSAGFATVIARGAGLASAGTTGGDVNFINQASAASATFDIQIGTVAGALPGTMEFSDNSTAESSTITINGAPSSGFLPATLAIRNFASAGNATITVKGGGLHDATTNPGASVKFSNNANAGGSNFSVEGGTATGGLGGSVEFHDNASMGVSNFTVHAAAAVGDDGGGKVDLFNNSSAASATFTIEGAKNSSASTQTGGSVSFHDQATAGSATFNNMPATTALVSGGTIKFFDSSSAGAATLKNVAGAVQNGFGGLITFAGNSSAANSTIVSEAGAASSGVLFTQQSSAGNANIHIGSSSNASFSSSLVAFLDNADGGLATFIIDKDANFDISTLLRAGMTAGSIAGAGNFTLDNKGLTTGGTNTSTIVSGPITSTGGGLTKTGSGTLTLGNLTNFAGPINVNAGKVSITAPFTTGTIVTAGNNGILQMATSPSGNSTLSIPNVTVTGQGQIDITNNKLISKNDILGTWDGSKYTGITGLVQSGYHNGAWDGRGIITSIATAATTLGVARADDIGMVGKNFGGVTAGGNDVLVRYTFAGDADLDGKVGFSDLVRLAQNYNSTTIPAAIPGAPANFESDLAAAFASVPEPGAGLIVFASVAILARPRNRKKAKS